MPSPAAKRGQNRTAAFLARRIRGAAHRRDDSNRRAPAHAGVQGNVHASRSPPVEAAKRGRKPARSGRQTPTPRAPCPPPPRRGDKIEPPHSWPGVSEGRRATEPVQEVPARTPAPATGRAPFGGRANNRCVRLLSASRLSGGPKILLDRQPPAPAPPLSHRQPDHPEGPRPGCARPVRAGLSRPSSQSPSRPGGVVERGDLSPELVFVSLSQLLRGSPCVDTICDLRPCTKLYAIDALVSPAASVSQIASVLPPLPSALISSKPTLRDHHLSKPPSGDATARSGPPTPTPHNQALPRREAGTKPNRGTAGLTPGPGRRARLRPALPAPAGPTRPRRPYPPPASPPGPTLAEERPAGPLLQHQVPGPVEGQHGPAFDQRPDRLGHHDRPPAVRQPRLGSPRR